MDILAFQLKKRSYLAEIRYFRSHYPQGVPAKAISSSRLRRLRLISSKLPLISFFPDEINPKYISFKNESQWLNLTLSCRPEGWLQKRSLSISQKNHIYASSEEIEIEKIHSIEEWKHISVAIIATSFTTMTGQEKMANRLRTSRVRLNQLLKSCQFLKIENNFIPLTESHYTKPGVNKKEVIGKLKSVGLTGYRTDSMGRLLRQLPNTYSLKHTTVIRSAKKTYHYQNKILNCSFFDRLEDSKRVSIGMPRTKEISIIKFLASKQAKAFTSKGQVLGNGKKSRKIKNGFKKNVTLLDLTSAQARVNQFYSQNKDGVGLIELPSKLLSEAYLLRGLGFNLYHGINLQTAKNNSNDLTELKVSLKHNISILSGSYRLLTARAFGDNLARVSTLTKMRLENKQIEESLRRIGNELKLRKRIQRNAILDKSLIPSVSKQEETDLPLCYV